MEIFAIVLVVNAVISLGIGIFSSIKGLGFAYGYWFSFFLGPLIGWSKVSDAICTECASIASNLTICTHNLLLPFAIRQVASNAVISVHHANLVAIEFLDRLGAIIVAGTNPSPAVGKEIEVVLLNSGQGKKCPFCAEVIKTEAIKCRFCGEAISAEDGAPEVPVLRELMKLTPDGVSRYQVNGVRQDGREVTKIIEASGERTAVLRAKEAGISPTRITKLISTEDE